MVAKVGERLAVIKQTLQKFYGERFNLRKLNELQVRKQYQIEIKNRFAALGNLSGGEDIKSAWQNIKENIKTPAEGSLGLHELKQHKARFYGECLGFLGKGSRLKCSGCRV